MTQEGGPTEEELLEQLRQLRVEDILLQTVVTLVNVSGHKLTAPEAKDVEQAKQGIDAARAILPLCPQEQLAPIKEALSQLQMLYVRETQQPEPGDQPQPEQKAQPEQRPKPDIWTPGSS